MRIPKLRRKVIRGHGYGHARFSKVDFYFGSWPNESHCPKEVRARYEAELAKWLHGGRQPRHQQTSTIAELLVQFLQWAEKHYHDSTEFRDYCLSLKEVRTLHGCTLLNKFTLSSLEEIRSAMIDRGFSRTLVNQRIGRVKRVFKWAAQRQLIPADQWAYLHLLEPLRRGRSAAPEPRQVTFVPSADVEAILPYVSPQIASLVRLQQWTGMRPGEVVQMRWSMLSVSEETWIYRVWFKSKERLIPIGPRAQFLLSHWRRDDDRPIFQPKESRFTPRAGEQYCVVAYDRAVARACVRAGVNHWHPHQLRHAHATAVQEAVADGLSAARFALGHESSAITRRYAHAELQIAVNLARKWG